MAKGRVTPFPASVQTDTTYNSFPAPDDHAATNKPSYIIIRSGLLIPGDGEPVQNGALVIEGKVIVWVGQKGDVPGEYLDAKHRLYDVPYLMPGLWECHSHFGGAPTDENNVPQFPKYVDFQNDHPAIAGARLARGLWETIQRGYTSLRDVAGWGCEVAKAVDDGTIVGPNIYSAGGFLSQLAGHGDVFPLPAGDVLLNMGVSQITPGHHGSAFSCIVDGVDECRRGVRLQIRRGAKCIKLCATGGILSRDDNPLQAQFSPEELQTIVTEAKRADRAVAAHAHGKPGIIEAVKAGVTTLEHGAFADQECIDLMRREGTVYVGTRNVFVQLLATGGQGLQKESWEKAKICADSHWESYKAIAATDIPFALGTDTPPGYNMAIELAYAVKAGMSNLEAIKAATANGPLTVKGQAPKTGQLKVGYEADVIGVLKNPVGDVEILQTKNNIGWVWKGGKIFKGPGVGPWGEEEFEWP